MPGTVGSKLRIVPPLHLDAAPDETAEQAFNDLLDLLRAEGVEGDIGRVNPITHDQWILIITGAAASLGTLLNGIGKVIEVWQKGRPDRNGQSSYDQIQIDLKAPVDTEFRIIIGPSSKAQKHPRSKAKTRKPKNDTPQRGPASPKRTKRTA